MNKVIGMLAHVDAGKTTLSEQLLYKTQSIRTLGRVDQKNAFLDNNRIERERGITIFSGQASFTYSGSTYFLVDTPGHEDFSAEMERALSILDFAVLVVSLSDGIQGHTETIWRLLRSRGIPTLIFLNKTDQAGADTECVLQSLHTRFSPMILDFTNAMRDNTCDDTLTERIAEMDDSLLERYLSNTCDPDSIFKAAQRLISECALFPCFCGSALLGDGIDELLNGLDRLCKTNYSDDTPLSGKVYKIRRDVGSARVAFLKLTGGILHVKDELTGEKINELRNYQGTKYSSVSVAHAGELVAETGLANIKAGDGFGAFGSSDLPNLTPMLAAAVLYNESIPAQTMLRYFKELEDEDPCLHVEWEDRLKEIRVSVMGDIQLEVLTELIRDRYGAEVSFGECKVLYRETILAPVMGYGHFEPLRHYSEIHLRLSPGKRGSGITFCRECPTDNLAESWQRLIETHVFEREHKGVLIGAPLTDVLITLVRGRAHEKHTSGGDFREAVYRAIRQGLMHAQSVLLEPYCAFTIDTDVKYIGRVLSDAARLNANCAAPENNEHFSRISGRAPIETFRGYVRELYSFAGGNARISLNFDGYEPCHNTEEIISRSSYESERDIENTADSVFCTHGAGFTVKWNDVEQYLHLK